VIIDYYEADKEDELLAVQVGVQFEDEPGSLYAVTLKITPEGHMEQLRLMYNGFECKYSFQDAEVTELQDYLAKEGIIKKESSP
jgi:hypothetical protein